MYAIVPIVNGVRDMDDKDLIQAIDNGDGTCICHIQDTATPRPSWRTATDQDWQAALARIPQPAPMIPLEQQVSAIGQAITKIRLKMGV